MNILVIDDEQEIREMLAEYLDMMGHQVRMAENGQDGLDIILSDGAGLDAVILDNKMPLLSGQEVMDRLRTEAPNLPVVMISGHSDLDGSDIHALGVRAFIEKPFSFVQVTDALSRIPGGGK